MSTRLTWLPGVLRAAGLKVAEQPGWVDRGADMGDIVGVICHHTGTPRDGNMPTLKMLTDGVVQASGKLLPGPLAQLGLGRDGTYYVVAAGRCNHAGKGEWKGFTTGNTNFIGIEAENRGSPADPWPQVQLDAYRRGVAAILKHVDARADYCCAHREYALPKGRKNDPHSLDMDDFRAKVAALMAGTGVVTNPVVPAVDAAQRPTLKRGDKGEAVRIVQRAVGVSDDGNFGPGTEAAVRAFQRTHDLVPDGIIGPKSWLVIPDADKAPKVFTAPAAAPRPALTRLAWGAKVSPAFRDKVVSICADLGVAPDDLMACMAFESGGSFAPDKRNAAGSGAVGLIQFMPSTAISLQTTSAELAAMTAEDQLDYVRKYFAPYRGRLHNLGDLYMAILWPRGVGKPDEYALFVQSDGESRAYLQNRGLDIDKDGVVTRGEACAKIKAKLVEGQKPENLFVAA